MKSASLIVPVLSLFLLGCTAAPSSDTNPPAPADASAKPAAASDQGSQTPTKEESRYIPYTAEKFESLKGSSPFIVFFYADWCPTCRNWEAMLLQGIETLPDETIILKANFDTEKELKKELGINTQSTAVFFDNQGTVTQTVLDPSIDVIKHHFKQ